MELNYEKSALQGYMDDIVGVGTALKRTKDDSIEKYNSCKQRYTRLHTELEQAIRSAYNKVEAAESMQRAADAEYERAMRNMQNAEDDSARSAAEEQLRHARARQAEAAHEMEIAAAEYRKSQNRMKKLTEIGERYQPSAETAVKKVEEDFSAFFTVVNSGNSDLGEYIDIMERAQSALYDGTAEVSSSVGASSSCVSASFGSSDNSACTDNSASVLTTNAGNTLKLSKTDGAENIVMNVSGESYTFPNTKSGAAKAYRIALKSGDDELIERTDNMFSSFGK